MRRATILILAAGLAAAASGRADAARVSIFYYPWYGTPALDGAYQHWHQNGARPPVGVASGYFPARGVYSSSNVSVLRAQMREIRRAGIDKVVVSWWGRGSVEHFRLPGVLHAARRAGLRVAVHIEPYPDRTPASTRADVEHLRGAGITDYFVYAAGTFPPEQWAEAIRDLKGVRLLAQTPYAGFAARGGFEGMYTYDILTWGGDKFGRICAAARRLRLVCAPSVGPGYDARRAVGDSRVKPRRNGTTYDAMWQAALRAHADEITITSYNEWHEGTQVEPARAYRNALGEWFAGYAGAWGKYGQSARHAYLDRTAFWSARFASTARSRGAAGTGRSAGAARRGPQKARPSAAGRAHDRRDLRALPR